jgi:hypothetical protein
LGRTSSRGHNRGRRRQCIGCALLLSAAPLLRAISLLRAGVPTRVERLRLGTQLLLRPRGCDTFTGKDPIVHSRSRTGACMAISVQASGKPGFRRNRLIWRRISRRAVVGRSVVDGSRCLLTRGWYRNSSTRRNGEFGRAAQRRRIGLRAPRFSQFDLPRARRSA